jgi:uncharacterized protein YwqG
MLPDFLGEFRAPLERYKLDYVKVLATPLPAGESLPLLQSKFLGHPYLPVGMPYPHDEKGQPMLLLAQLNFAEIPALAGFPTTGILQFFVSPTEWYDAEDCQVLYHPATTAPAQIDFSFLTSDLYADSPIRAEHSLAFSLATEYGGAEDCRFDMTFGGKDYYEYLETLPLEQQEELDTYCNNSGHRLGGYAYFTQRDPREHDSDRQADVQLLQIDIDEQIMFGDSGLGHFFISPAALAAKQFDQAYFYWDCC